MQDKEPLFKADVGLDAILVDASMNGLFEAAAIQLGMTTVEAFGRAKWLKRQPEKYIMEVSDKVAQMQIEREKKLHSEEEPE